MASLSYVYVPARPLVATPLFHWLGGNACDGRMSDACHPELVRGSQSQSTQASHPRERKDSGHRGVVSRARAPRRSTRARAGPPQSRKLLTTLADYQIAVWRETRSPTADLSRGGIMGSGRRSCRALGIDPPLAFWVVSQPELIRRRVTGNGTVVGKSVGRRKTSMAV